MIVDRNDLGEYKDLIVDISAKKYNDYDIDSIIYLTLEIYKYLKLDDEFLYIDLYSEEIKKIFKDFKKNDDKNVSFLDSIDKYIEKNIEKIQKNFDKTINK